MKLTLKHRDKVHNMKRVRMDITPKMKNQTTRPLFCVVPPLRAAHLQHFLSLFALFIQPIQVLIELSD